MFIFAHAGLTLGAAVLLTGVFAKHSENASGEKENTKTPRASSRFVESRISHSTSTASRFISLARRIDIRILLIGSLLPDIIDKPVGRVFFRETFQSGRIFSHTLLFLILLTAGGLILYLASRKNWLLVLAFGTFTHLILDGMWMDTHTFLWPLYGFSFAKEPVSLWPWIVSMLNHIASDPWVLIPEIAGVIIIAWFSWQLVQSRKLIVFLKYGRI